MPAGSLQLPSPVIQHLSQCQKVFSHPAPSPAIMSTTPACRAENTLGVQRQQRRLLGLSPTQALQAGTGTRALEQDLQGGPAATVVVAMDRGGAAKQVCRLPCADCLSEVCRSMSYPAGRKYCCCCSAHDTASSVSEICCVPDSTGPVTLHGPFWHTHHSTACVRRWLCNSSEAECIRRRRL